MAPEIASSNAQEALDRGDVEGARRWLLEAIDRGGRAEDLNTLAAVELQLGRPELAAGLAEQALARAIAGDGPLGASQAAPSDLALATRCALTLATAAEDQDDARGAMAAFSRALALQPGLPDAERGLGYLLLSTGAIDEGLAHLDRSLEGDGASEELHKETQACRDAVRAFASSGTAPRVFLEAHRNAYDAFFTRVAERQEAKGWIAEAAKMRKDSDGRLVPAVPAGARPWAAVRVDLVDPKTGQVGFVGDQPLVVALPGYEPLARNAVLFPWKGPVFELFASSQCPWDQLPIHVALCEDNAQDAVEALFGEWYTAGYKGAFGHGSGGRFHDASDPELRGRSGMVCTFDLGRAGNSAIDDLLGRLADLHARHPIRRVLLGRGHLA
jgi:tetratricopeptide (TPR) repeat protein